MIQCKGGHKFCTDCASRGTDVAMSDGKTSIKCLGGCEEEIGWKELEKAVGKGPLAKMLKRDRPKR